MRKAVLILVTTLLLTTLAGMTQPQAVMAKSLTDISSSWAKDDITTLVDRGIITGYPDGTFRPGNSVTRAEFAKMIAKAFNLDPTNTVTFKDAQNHWAKGYIGALASEKIITGYPDGTFRPDQSISRAEVTAIVTRMLKVTDKDVKLASDWPATFTDVKTDNWAFASVEIGNRLGLFPSSITTAFSPDKAADRAETAHMIRVATDLQVTEGTVTATDPANNTITVKPVSGTDRVFTLPYDVVLLRNGTTTDIQNVMTGDTILTLATADGNPRVIKATGLVTKADVSSRIASMTKGALDADQVAALMSGDKDALQGSLKVSLYDRLTALGATPDEADSILSKNWSGLTGAAKDRLAAALGAQLSVDPQVAGALIDQNWTELQNLAEIQLTSNLIAKLF